MSDKRPVVWMIAGPNGSGKSTFTNKIQTLGVYVNADDMKAERGLTDLEAAQQAEALRNKLVENREDFTFETVLSTDRNILLIERAKQCGYEVLCAYFLTCDVNINVARVKMRSAAGGHDVPEEKIRKRYQKALELLPRLIAICDKILIYDKSDNISQLIFSKKNANVKPFPNQRWPEARLLKLIGM